MVKTLRVALHQRKKWGNKEYLLDLLGKTAVRFVYRTVTDGSAKGGSPKGRLRLAEGTRNLQLVPASKQPKSFRPYSRTTKTYYDYGKKQWRSFRSVEVVSILNYLDTKTGKVLNYAAPLDGN
ncbi:SH3 beta-barrel fold-containing protein [Hymenobacter pini]|uniref:SH3 beta-barrel fold-containing protein n=1 Tax=Hymenobacter pini TaxID=2880879 RepID=UPI001CF12FAE|nr:SH3 beta-barrel fold-containing protein [Hymenobacter pini]MCA8829441.1 SH3 beta-barrel fold-containing protein [Hymenobacter pini]